MRRIVLLALLALPACGSARPTHHGAVRVASAELVAIDPEVQVVADADQPVFFAGGRYWLFHDGRWWHAATLREHWTFEPAPPVAVQQIAQPYAYTHYRKDHPRTQPARTPPASPPVTSPSATAAREPPPAPSPTPRDDKTAPPNSASTDPSVDPTLNMFSR